MYVRCTWNRSKLMLNCLLSTNKMPVSNAIKWLPTWGQRLDSISMLVWFYEMDNYLNYKTMPLVYFILTQHFHLMSCSLYVISVLCVSSFHSAAQIRAWARASEGWDGASSDQITSRLMMPRIFRYISGGGQEMETRWTIGTQKMNENYLPIK